VVMIAWNYGGTQENIVIGIETQDPCLGRALAHYLSSTEPCAEEGRPWANLKAGAYRLGTLWVLR